MNRYFKVLLVSSTVVILGLAALYGYAERWVRQPLPITEDTRVVLEPGQPFAGFVRNLAAVGLIDRPSFWIWRARLLGQARRVQAGEYDLLVGDSAGSLIERLLAGKVAQYQVRLLEGWTVFQVLETLSANEVLLQTLMGADENTLLAMLGLPGGHAEGMFFPDTYQFERGASDADVLRRSYSKLEEELARAWETRSAGLPFASPYEALIAASLVEKETGRDDDRPHIAQVFVSRLHRGMRLQTDPSVIYGVGRDFDGNLTRRHLRTDTPYNTYTRKGLPPTPIAIVGTRSLQAAVHPTEGEYLYFVSRGDGSSQFSVSLKEHQAAVQKYQLQ